MSDTPPAKSPLNPYESPTSSVRRQAATRDVLLMCASLTVLSVLGCAFIFSYWSLADAITVGIVRCVGFVAIMAGIHFVGYRLWKRQLENSVTRASAPQEPTNLWSQNVPHGLFWVVVITILLLLFLALRL